MKKWIFIIFTFCSLDVLSQELQMPEFEEPDSLQLEMQSDQMHRPLMLGSFNSLNLMFPFSFSELDFDAGPSNRWSFDSSELFTNHLQVNEYFSPFLGLAPSPFFSNESVFSSAAYKINDRFILGGYSFGANSVFTAPLPGQGMNSFDVRGSTMFMQYKVSKNFKIETRVNVIQGPGPGY